MRTLAVVCVSLAIDACSTYREGEQGGKNRVECAGISPFGAESPTDEHLCIRSLKFLLFVLNFSAGIANSKTSFTKSFLFLSSCLHLFFSLVQQIVSIRFFFLNLNLNLARKFKIQNFFFGNLIKELLATLRYRNIFLLSWYPIEKKTNKNRGKEDGDGENVVILITDDQHVFIGADSALSSRLFCRQIFIVKTRRYI